MYGRLHFLVRLTLKMGLLIRDDAHYFVYDCKDNQAQDVEMFEADKEKEIATTFATRIHEKLSKGA